MAKRPNRRDVDAPYFRGQHTHAFELNIVNVNANLSSNKMKNSWNVDQLKLGDFEIRNIFFDFQRNLLICVKRVGGHYNIPRVAQRSE